MMRKDIKNPNKATEGKFQNESNNQEITAEPRFSRLC